MENQNTTVRYRITALLACILFIYPLLVSGAGPGARNLQVANVEDELEPGDPVVDSKGVLVPENSGAILVGTFAGMTDAEISANFSSGNLQGLRDAFTPAEETTRVFGFEGAAGRFKSDIPVEEEQGSLLGGESVFVWMSDASDFLDPNSEHLIFRANTTFDDHFSGETGLVIAHATGTAVVGQAIADVSDLGVPAFSTVAIPEAAHVALAMGLMVFWIGIRRRRRS